jgi:Protein of unknown function (DUF2637)/Homeodomain-like domain
VTNRAALARWAGTVTVFSVVIALAGWSVSYSTQAQLAQAHHFATWEAWLWPAIADAAALAVMLRLHLGQVRAGWYTVEAWLVFAICSGLMVGANAVQDSADPMGAGMHAAVPVVAMLLWHLVVHGRPAAEPSPAFVSPRPLDPATRAQLAATADADETSPDGVSPRPVRQPRETVRRSGAGQGTEDMRQRAARLLRDAPGVSASEAGRQLGVSRSHAARLLKAARLAVRAESRTQTAPPGATGVHGGAGGGRPSLTPSEAST